MWRKIVLHPRFERCAARVEAETAWTGGKRTAAAAAAAESAADGSAAAVDSYSILHTTAEDEELLRVYYDEGTTALLNALAGYDAVLTKEGDIIIRVVPTWDSAQRVDSIIDSYLADYVLSRWSVVCGDTAGATAATERCAGALEQLSAALSARRRPVAPVFNEDNERVKDVREW